MRKFLSFENTLWSAVVLMLVVGANPTTGHALDAGRADPFNTDHGCLLQPHRVVHLSSPVQGRLVSVPVERGASVAKGAVIARLESKFERAEVDAARARAANDSRIRSAKARLTFLNSRLQRKIKLWKKDLMPLAVIEETLNDVLGEDLLIPTLQCLEAFHQLLLPVAGKLLHHTAQG